MFDARTRTVSDGDIYRLLDGLIRAERTSSGPTAFNANDPVHREAVNLGLAVVRPWPLSLKGEPERQCLLVSVTTGWKWIRLHRAARRSVSTQERRPAIWPIHRPRPAYVSNTY